ncbi:hypothetical protein [Streptomyces millisiae]|uniref:Transposase n=1 Tax=Streptomyces millisiae TaxID=3075542 RepID=A0ABU2LXB1_9ACTN|nr:hypothetical protein [Streptomyces sp. DSM 44918]MDT0322240.1 hypothetical protein [Streptomyces sp. DSM 44918]
MNGGTHRRRPADNQTGLVAHRLFLRHDRGLSARDFLDRVDPAALDAARSCWRLANT